MTMRKNPLHTLLPAAFAGSALAVLLAGPALAQSNNNVARSQDDVPVSPTGLSLQLGGGVTGFARQDARDRFGTGGYWDLRAVFGTESFLGAELAYVGSAREATASGLTADAGLLGNGAEAVFRVNLPLGTGSFRFEPFLFGGVGWTYYSLVNSDSNTSTIKDGANAFVVPFGAGLSAAYDHFLIDARFTYRPVFDDELVAMGSDDSLDLQHWSVGLTLGYEL
jgi:hypothetical protein